MIGNIFRICKSLVAIPVLLIIALLPFSSQILASSQFSSPVATSQLSPENTVILANKVDARFCRDYSILLKNLRLEWIILDSLMVPDAVKNKNIIIIGRLDATYTGEIMREVMTSEEIEAVHSTSTGQMVLEKMSPWDEDKRVYICIGAIPILTRDAAEDGIRSIIERSPPASAWIRNRFDAVLDEKIHEYVEQLRFSWDDQELPLAELTMDVGANRRRSISSQQAQEDVERLFYLFSHGYSGYAFFNENGEFEKAKARIEQELSYQSQWSVQSFSRLLYDNLSFITDCHLRIGDYQYADHYDFWYDTKLQLAIVDQGYQLRIEGTDYIIASVSDQDPEEFVFPSLNNQGEPIYRLGILSKTEPAPLSIEAENDTEKRNFEVELHRSDFDYYSSDIFREDEIGGIPVIRVRSFGDPNADALSEFVETASTHKGEPVIIIDARGNGGGNEAWPISWIQGLTGEYAKSIFIFSELRNITTMAGRANVFAYLSDRYPHMDNFRVELKQHTNIAEAFERGAEQPYWFSPEFQEMTLIENDTTVIIIMNGKVASAGEGLIMRASRAENVVLVGENTMGALAFGNAGFHKLPNSRLMINLPINFGLFPDTEFREEKGLSPDFWVPAADAVNYAVAAVRNGTIMTCQPLSPAILDTEFIPENPNSRNQRDRLITALLIAAYAAAASIWAYFMRRKPRIIVMVGAVWLIFSIVWLFTDRGAIGFGFLLAGIICLTWGGTNLIKVRKRSQ